jgi:hypothetical protein
MEVLPPKASLFLFALLLIAGIWLLLARKLAAACAAFGAIAGVVLCLYVILFRTAHSRSDGSMVGPEIVGQGEMLFAFHYQEPKQAESAAQALNSALGVIGGAAGAAAGWGAGRLVFGGSRSRKK